MPDTVSSEALSMCPRHGTKTKYGDFQFFVLDWRSLHNRSELKRQRKKLMKDGFWKKGGKKKKKGKKTKRRVIRNTAIGEVWL